MSQYDTISWLRRISRLISARVTQAVKRAGISPAFSSKFCFAFLSLHQQIGDRSVDVIFEFYYEVSPKKRPSTTRGRSILICSSSVLSCNYMIIQLFNSDCVCSCTSCSPRIAPNSPCVTDLTTFLVDSNLTHSQRVDSMRFNFTTNYTTLSPRFESNYTTTCHHKFGDIMSPRVVKSVVKIRCKIPLDRILELC